MGINWNIKAIRALRSVLVQLWNVCDVQHPFNCRSMPVHILFSVNGRAVARMEHGNFSLLPSVHNITLKRAIRISFIMRTVLPCPKVSLHCTSFPPHTIVRWACEVYVLGVKMPKGTRSDKETAGSLPGSDWATLCWIVSCHCYSQAQMRSQEGGTTHCYSYAIKNRSGCKGPATVPRQNCQ